jgi:hypothetical protein
MSSSTRQQERDEYSSNDQQPQQHEAAIGSIDQTKEGIRRSIEEVRREMPRYSQTVTNFQNETADAAMEIANNFLESQKEIISSLQSAWAPMVGREEEGEGRYWITPGMMMGMLLSPREMTDIYARTIGVMTEAYVASTRMTTGLMFAGMEAARATTNYVRQNAKEAARVTSNTARTFAQTAAKKETVQVEGEQSGKSASGSSSFSGVGEAATTTTAATTFTNEAAGASSSRTGATTAETGARIDTTTATAGSTEKTRKR